MRVGTAVRMVLAGALLALSPAAEALGHGGIESHFAEDSAVHDVADEPRLGARTREATAADARAAAAAIAGNEHEVGQWSPVVDWPVVGVHVALLPQRQGARLRLRRRQRDRNLPGARPHARDSVGSRDRHADARLGGHRVQRLL